MRDMFDMCYYITIGNYQLALFESVEIHKSVDVLAATCTIKLPDAAYNHILRQANNLQRGDKVNVQLAYDNHDTNTMPVEFSGYLLSVNTDKESIELSCEDSLFILRKPVKNKQFQKCSVKDIVNYILQQTGVKMQLDCTMTISYDKFTIANANAYDVLKKLQEDTKANIFIEDTQNGKTLATPILHVHMLYEKISGKVVYGFQYNIEESDLKYKRKEDLKIEIVLKTTDKKGTVHEFKYGNTGGEKKVSMVSGLSQSGLKQRAKNEYDSWVYDGYEGNITGWLIPYCAPTFEVAILDEDYPDKDGIYYVTGTTLAFDENGAKRKVEIAKKLGTITNGQIAWTGTQNL